MLFVDQKNLDYDLKKNFPSQIFHSFQMLISIFVSMSVCLSICPSIHLSIHYAFAFSVVPTRDAEAEAVSGVSRFHISGWDSY